MAFWSTLGNSLAQGAGAQASSDILGGLFGQLNFGIGELTGYNRKIKHENWKEQKALAGMQLELGKQSAEHEFGLQKKMWEETNAPAQVEQLKKAGLNPALMYGSGGGGGATTRSADVQAPRAGQGTILGMEQIRAQRAEMGMQMASLKSTIDLNESQAEKNRAEANNIADEGKKGMQLDNKY
jgi:hypothetical protein